MGRRLGGSQARAQRPPTPNWDRALGSSDRVEQTRCLTRYPSTDDATAGAWRRATAGAEPRPTRSRRQSDEGQARSVAHRRSAHRARRAPRIGPIRHHRGGGGRQSPGRARPGPAGSGRAVAGRCHLYRQLRAAAESGQLLHHGAHVHAGRPVAGRHRSHRPDARAAAGDHPLRQRQPGAADRGRRPPLAPDRAEVPGYGWGRRHHPRRRGAAGSGTGALQPRARPHHDPRSGERPEARHRAQQRQHVREEQLHRRRPPGGAGNAGHRRLERARPLRHREQLHRGGRHRHPLRRLRAVASTSSSRPTSSSAATTSPGRWRGAAARGP